MFLMCESSLVLFQSEIWGSFGVAHFALLVSKLSQLSTSMTMKVFESLYKVNLLPLLETF